MIIINRKEALLGPLQLFNRTLLRNLIKAKKRILTVKEIQADIIEVITVA
jgi:hypothetical protein